MVMVIVGAAAVAAVLVELAGEKCVGPAVVLDGVENGHAVDRQCDRSPEKVLPGRHRLLAGTGCSGIRQALLPRIRLRERHLLLPGFDPDHHGMVGNAVRLDVEKLIIPAELERIGERLERLRDRRSIAASRPRAGRRSLGEQQDFGGGVEPADLGPTISNPISVPARSVHSA